jgi:hypothetical protein
MKSAFCPIGLKDYLRPLRGFVIEASPRASFSRRLGCRTASRGQNDAAGDRQTAGDLQGRDVLGEEEQRDDRRQEGLEIREQ